MIVEMKICVNKYFNDCRNKKIGAFRSGSMRRSRPTGKSMVRLSSPPRKNIDPSLLTQITCISLAIPAQYKGRFAIVTDVGSGCDGREWRD
jgi:hypothetical protein